MTPIQAASLPLALAGKDLIAQAKTGSGKTAAFALALLANLEPAPLRGAGAGAVPDARAGRPGDAGDPPPGARRRQHQGPDAVRRRARCARSSPAWSTARTSWSARRAASSTTWSAAASTLDALNTLVLDEADRMLDMGFFDDIADGRQAVPEAAPDPAVLGHLPRRHRQAGRRFMREPQEVKLRERTPPTQDPPALLRGAARDERLHAVGAAARTTTGRSARWPSATPSSSAATWWQVLQAQGFAALELHGDLEQRERDQVLVQFANRSCSVLVATDVAARGLDIAQLEAVINVDVTPDAEMHIHRIGRTGRADEAGWAFSLASLDEMGRVGRIEQMQGTPVEWHPLAELTPAERRAAAAADGDAADPRRPQGKDPPRRRAGRADRGPGLRRRAGRQDQRQRVLDLRGGGARHRRARRCAS